MAGPALLVLQLAYVGAAAAAGGAVTAMSAVAEVLCVVRGRCSTAAAVNAGPTYSNNGYAVADLRSMLCVFNASAQMATLLKRYPYLPHILCVTAACGEIYWLLTKQRSSNYY